MPTIQVALPHWLYWSGLVLFPLFGLWMVRRARGRAPDRLPSLAFAYLMLVTAGFVGAHRIYLHTRFWWVFVPLVFAVIFGNAEIRAARELVSAARSDVQHAAIETRRAEAAVQSGRRNAQERLAKARELAAGAETVMAAATSVQTRWERITLAVAGFILALLILDAVRLPTLWRSTRAREIESPLPDIVPVVSEVPHEPSPAAQIHTPVTDAIDGLNRRMGEFLAWWTLIAVFFYFFEVVLRYLFNSPTTFVHEAMFLMFGMMYLLSGGFAYLNENHVRVDIVYSRFSRRGKVLADALTSVFFFIFAATLVATSWIYLVSSFEVREVSFSDWAIQYWPIKAVMLLGSVLLLLQGVSRLIKDIRLVRSGEI
jgi:TRAP-type mannitol/chloroaromatic compound transport system permease small subunit